MRRPGYLAGFDDYGISPKEKAPETSAEDELILEARREIEQQAAKLEAQGMAGFGQYRSLSRSGYYPRRTTGVRVTPQRSAYSRQQAQLQAQLDYAKRYQAWQQQKHAWEMARAKELDQVASAAAAKAAAQAAARARAQAAAQAAQITRKPSAPPPPAPPVVKPSKGMSRPAPDEDDDDDDE